MNKQVNEVLAAWIEATEQPPPADAEPAEVLQAADTMLSRRKHLLSRLEALAENSGPFVAKTELLEELRLIDAQWQGALRKARHIAGERLSSYRRMRRRA